MIFLFKTGAPLRNEYGFLFRSLFKSSTIYRQVVEVVAKKNKGLSLMEIKEELGAGDSGNLTEVIDNLCKSQHSCHHVWPQAELLFRPLLCHGNNGRPVWGITRRFNFGFKKNIVYL